MKKNFIVLIVLVPLLSNGQINIVVEKVKLIETVDNKSVSEIPKVKDLTNANALIVEKINNQILERFMISSFNQNEIEEFRWYDVSCGYEIKDNILFIWFEGEYYGAYPNFIEDRFFFNIETGEQLKFPIIPFQALFSLSGYLDFMHSYWLDGVKKAFEEAIRCAEIEPYCSYYDIYGYYFDGNKISFSLADDCYPRVARACTPDFSLSVHLDTLKPYLNDIGRSLLLDKNKNSNKVLDMFVYNKRISEKVPNYVYIFGKIDNKYPFSMALDFEKNSDSISGYYFYDKKMQKLKLNGYKEGEFIYLSETLDGKETGKFQLRIGKEYNLKAFSIYNPYGESTYLTGEWSNPEKTRTFEIKFTEVKMNDRN